MLAAASNYISWVIGSGLVLWTAYEGIKALASRRKGGDSD